MPRIISHILVLCLLWGATYSARAFSLLGEFEAWQTPALGYDPFGTDIGAPKNLGEEYRWNIPVITYGFDNAFLTYFGSNGVAAIDDAFRILNSFTNGFSAIDLTREFPLVDPETGAISTFRDTRRENLRAAALNLVDMKSVALGLMMEELGLANPLRWTWALRDRKTTSDPDRTNYLVIQRNFDPVTLQPSAYVNGSRLTYEVLEFEDPNFADALEDVVPDPLYNVHAFSVAAMSGTLQDIGFAPGVFFTYLTRDDIGGLKYIYNTNNLNWEPFPDGTTIFTPDLNAATTISNMDLTLFSSQTLTLPPSVLTNLYPGLVVQSVTTNLFNQVVNVPVSTQVFVNVITNRGDLQVVQSFDLGQFSSITLTNPPAQVVNPASAGTNAALGAALANLQIVGFTQSITQRADIVSIVLTNGPRYPWGDPFQTNFVFVTNYFTNLAVNYHYTFGNVITNAFSARTRVIRETAGLEPWGDPTFPQYRTNISTSEIRFPSGNVIILPPGVLNYEFTGVRVTNLTVITNYFMETNFIAGNIIRTVRDAEYRIFTNVQYAAYPIIALTQGFFTNVIIGTVTNQAARYNYTFANVVTNYSSVAPVNVTEIIRDAAGNAIATNTYTTNVITGGFLIDVNQTGFDFTGLQTVSLIPSITVLNLTNSTTGTQLELTLSYIFTNTSFGILPFTNIAVGDQRFLRPGVDRLRFVKLGAGTLQGNFQAFTNRFEASYWTNQPVNGVLTPMLRTDTFQIVRQVNPVTETVIPDILFSAADLGVFNDSVFPIQTSRSANFVNNAALNSTQDQGGPGTIEPTVIITFNKVGPSYFNTFPGFTTEASVYNRGARPFIWGRFDGSTEPPIVFPQDISLEQVESLMLGNELP